MKKIALAAAMAGALSLMAASNAFADAAAAIAALDPDKDGTVDLAEAQAGGTKLFAVLDPDNDGTLDAKEYAEVIAQKFAAANPDNDGTVDAAELGSDAGKALLKLIQ